MKPIIVLILVIALLYWLYDNLKFTVYTSDQTVNSLAHLPVVIPLKEVVSSEPSKTFIKIGLSLSPNPTIP